MRVKTLGQVATALVAIAALVLSIVALTSDSSPLANRSRLAPSGIYVDGRDDVPHYFVAISSTEDNNVRGSMNFFYQDGQTSVVFTFAGFYVPTRTGGSSGVLTLTTTVAKDEGSTTQSAGSIPTTLSVLYGTTHIALGECTNYLHFASTLAACSFSRSHV